MKLVKDHGFSNFLRVGVGSFAFIMSVGIVAMAQDPAPSATPTPNPVIVSPTPMRVESTSPVVLPSDPPPVSPDFSAPLRPLPSAERVGVDVANQLSLTLEDAIKRALENNNDIGIARNNVEIAEFNLRGARGAYDPLIAAESYYERLTTPTASLIGGAVNGAVTQTRFFNSGGISGFSPWQGGVYSMRFDSSRTTTSNTNATLNPQYPTLLTFSYTQPLLRDRRTDANRRSIEIAKKNISLSDAQFRQRAIEITALVEQAYWNLAFALRNMQVQLDAVRQARTQLESNQRLVEKGVLAPIDIVAATAQISTFEQNVYQAQEQVTRAENDLKTLMLPDRSSIEWTRSITPVSPVTLDPPAIGLEVALAEAFKNRPELTQLEMSEEINKIDQTYYRNQTKPQIDLVGLYTTQGLAGSATSASFDPNTGASRVPQNLVGGLGASLGNLFAQDYPTFRVGVTVSLPWGNRAAKANLGRSLVEADRLKNNRDQTEQIIEAQVRNALQALRSADARLSSAISARSAAEQLFDSEQRQFQAGTTTFYLVQQRQLDLITARGRELQAQTDLNRAISEFQKATGNTLNVNNVSVSQGESFLNSPTGRKMAANARFYQPER